MPEDKFADLPATWDAIAAADDADDRSMFLVVGADEPTTANLIIMCLRAKAFSLPMYHFIDDEGDERMAMASMEFLDEYQKKSQETEMFPLQCVLVTNTKFRRFGFIADADWALMGVNKTQMEEARITAHLEGKLYDQCLLLTLEDTHADPEEWAMLADRRQQNAARIEEANKKRSPE